MSAISDVNSDLIESGIILLVAATALYFVGGALIQAIKDLTGWAGRTADAAIQSVKETATAASEAAQQPGSGEGAIYAPDDPYIY